MKLQKKELDQHRKLSSEIPQFKDDDDQINEKAPTVQQEFSFMPQPYDTVTDKSMDDVSAFSIKSQQQPKRKTKVCVDCKKAFRYPYDLWRHRGEGKDVCPKMKKLEKKLKKL